MSSWQRALLVILLLLLCVCGARGEDVSSGSQEFPFLGLVTGERVHLRSGPGLSYEVLLALPRRAKVAVTLRVGEWYGVRVPEEVSGYVHRDDVALGEGWAIVRRDRIHVRAGSSFSSTSLGTVGGEERLKVRRSLDEWVEVQVPDSCRAWIHGSYVTFLEPFHGDH